MKRILFALILVFVLAACSGGQASPQVSLEDKLLEMPGLPAGYTAGALDETAPAMFEKVKKPLRVIHVPLERQGAPGGDVTVLLYSKQEDLWDADWDLIHFMGDDRKGLPMIGDESYVDQAGAKGVNEPYVDFFFSRCTRAVVYIRLLGLNDRQVMYDFADQIDQKVIKAVLCPQDE